MPDSYDNAIARVKVVHAKLVADPVLGAAYTAASIADKVKIVELILAEAKEGAR